MFSRNFFCFISRGFRCYGSWNFTWLLFFLLAWSCEWLIIHLECWVISFYGKLRYYFCWWFITNDSWINIRISNKIRLSFSFQLIENDTISFHSFESFHELTLISWCVCFCNEMENSFYGYMVLFFLSHNSWLRWFWYSIYVLLIFNLYSLSIVEMQVWL